jgi:hypothetical protein
MFEVFFTAHMCRIRCFGWSVDPVLRDNSIAVAANAHRLGEF